MVRVNFLAKVSFTLCVCALGACGQTGFNNKVPENRSSNASSAASTAASPSVASPSVASQPVASSVPEITTAIAPSVLPEGIVKKVCSDLIAVPAIANPWLALAAPGTEFVYPNFRGVGVNVIDRAPEQSPIIHSSDCVIAGKKLIFETDSTASIEKIEFVQKGEGRLGQVASFTLGAQRGLSNVKAPLDSLIAVFIPAEIGVGLSAPENLDFGTDAARDFQELSPKLRQVFFIGDGKRADGSPQKFVVPAGAVKIAFGNMDVAEWNNNAGSHQVKVNEANP